jgi:hypothetical protein
MTFSGLDMRFVLVKEFFQHPANSIEKGLDFWHEIEYIIFDHEVGA